MTIIVDTFIQNKLLQKYNNFSMLKLLVIQMVSLSP